MNILTYRITLDAHKNGIQRTLQGFQTGENLARQIRINLVSNSEGYELPADDSIVAMMYITKPGATEQSVNACTIDGNTIVYDVLPNDVEISGIVKMQLKLINTSVDGARNVLIAPAFAMEVSENDVVDSSVESRTTFTALENAIAQARAVFNSRIVDVEITEDLVFSVHYADNTTYESDTFTKLNEAEKVRVLAEKERIMAELERVEAEKSRTDNVNKAISDVENATNRANTAAGACEEIIKSNLPVASTTVLGAIKVDGSTITVDKNGVASASSDAKTLEGKTAKEFADSKHGHNIEEISDFPTEITPSAHTHSAEDIEGLSISAENTTYNNTTSGLEATSVQDAIDELFSMINTLIASLGTQVTYEYDATNVSLNIVPIETEEGA